MATSPYSVTCDVSIGTNTTFQIDPGVIIKFASGTGLYLADGATLDAQGTITQTIVFTSLQDDTFGGDTNGDGSLTTAAAGDWKEIGATNAITPSSLRLDFVTVRYGGNCTLACAALSSAGHVQLTNSQLELLAGDGIKLSGTGALTATQLVSGTVITHNAGNGITLNGSTATITNNTITNNNFHGIYALDSSPIIQLNTLANNGIEDYFGARYYGIYATNSSATIIGNTLTDNVYGDGIYLSTNPLSPTGAIMSNTLTITSTKAKYQHYTGITTIGTPDIRGNTVSGYLLAAQIAGGFPVQVPTYTNNDFNGTNVYRTIGVSGNLGQGTWQSVAGYVPIVAGDASIPAGATLTIPAGIVVKFLAERLQLDNTSNGSSFHVVPGSTLTATGTSTATIIFTSSRDDGADGIDTNNNGSANAPIPSDWGGIIDTSLASLPNTTITTMTFESVQLRYAGGYDYYSGAPAIVSYGQLHLLNSRVELSAGNGIGLYATGNLSPTQVVSGTTIISNTGHGIATDNGAPAFYNNTITGNGSSSYGIYATNSMATIQGNTLTNNAYGIYFTSANGQPTGAIISNTLTISSTDPTYQRHIGITTNGAPEVRGNIVHGYLLAAKIENDYPLQPVYTGNDFAGDTVYQTVGVGGTVGNGTWGTISGYTPVVAGGITIPASGQFTITAGTVMKFLVEMPEGITIERTGKLDINGTVAQPIILTSSRDDTYGGDTNHDAKATGPNLHDWGGIYADGIATEVSSLTMRYTTVRYGYSDYYHTSQVAAVGNVTLQSVVIEYSLSTGLYVDSSAGLPATFSIQNSTIRYNSGDGIVVGANIVGTPNINGNSLYANTGYGLRNNTAGTVDARNNDWGSIAGPNAPNNGIYGPAIYDPWTGKDAWIAYNATLNADWARFGANTVNMVFGSYAYQHSDLTLPILGGTFDFLRTYNSAITATSALGAGWSHAYDMRLQVVTGTFGMSPTIQILHGDGGVTAYRQDTTTAVYLPPPGTFASLALGTDATFTETLKNQTRYHFTSAGRLDRMVDRNGNVTTLTYTNGDLTTLTEPTGRSVTFTYDTAHHLLQLTDPAGRTVTFTYTAGRLARVTDPANASTNYTYDAAGRLATITDANGHTVVSNTFNAAGRVTDQRDAANNLTTIGYDLVNRTTTVTNTRGYTTTFVYDAQARVVQETDALGMSSYDTYDTANNHTSSTDRLGKTTNYQYDGHGNVTLITDPLGQNVTMTYDAQNNRLTRQDPRLNTTVNTYDALGNLRTVTDPLNNTSITTYTATGLRSALRNPQGAVSSYAYDSDGNLITLTDPLGNATNYTYDTAGNRITVTRPGGEVITYTYDLLSRTTGYTFTGYTASYVYDAVGNRTSMTDPTGTTSYTYDAFNRLLTVTTPGAQTITYGYDTAGNRVSLTYPDGKVVATAYDAANRLTNVTDWATRVVTYTYDAAAHPTQAAYPNNVTTTYSYDNAGQLTTINHALGATALANFAYTYDAAGNRTSMVDGDGTTGYTYDTMNQLSAVGYPNADSVSYGYDAAGNRTLLTTNAVPTTYVYDAADHLSSIDSVPLTWDSNGALLANTSGITYTYDALGRLTKIGSGTSYTYNADGQRRTQTISGTTTTYLYDLLAPNALVLVATTGGTSTIYTYGRGLLAASTGSTQTYYHTDALGSVRLLTDGAGAVVGTYSYDAFGALRSSSGTQASANPFRFAGEQSDASGLIYLRARYYDPATGRFITRDAQPEFPVRNGYLYAANNPVNVTEPSGQSPQGRQGGTRE